MNFIDRPLGKSDGSAAEWGSDAAATMLRELGIRHVAINPGASFRGFHDSVVNFLGNSDPQLLLCLHEDHAVSIAHGYAKVTDEAMACFLHSNVGLTHGLMAIYNAWCDRVPMLVLNGNGPAAPESRRPWIDWIHTTKDSGALLRNFVKWDDEPRSLQAIPGSLLRALRSTNALPQAPAFVCLDAGLQEARLGAPVLWPDPERHVAFSEVAASGEALDQAVAMLSGARNCVVLFGRGSRKQDDWDRRVEFVEKLGATAMTSILQRAVFPTDHPQHPLRPFYYLPESAAHRLRDADVILSLDWVDLNGLLRQIDPGAGEVASKVINVSLDHLLHNGWGMDHFGLPEADLNLAVGPDTFVRQALDRLGGRPSAASGYAPRALKPREYGAHAEEFLTVSDIEIALARAEAPKPITLAHVASGWSGDIYPFRGPLDYLGGDGGGGLSSGPGIALGAALALKDSDRIVVTVIGDGDAMQGISALWTAAHYRLPLLYIIANNSSNFNDEIHQEAVARHRGRPEGNRWVGQRIADPDIDFSQLAHGQGVDAIGPVRNATELEAALATAYEVASAGKPFLIDVTIVPGYVNPIVTSFGAAS